MVAGIERSALAGTRFTAPTEAGQHTDRTAFEQTLQKAEQDLKKDPDDPPPETEPEPKPLSADTKRPPGDNRSAADIIRGNPALANLSAVDKEFLKNGYSDSYATKTFGKDFDVTFKGVGDFEKDPDAAYRAAKVLEHIENFDEEGNAITGDSIGDGRIEGWTRGDRNDPKSEAEHGTEAGRFQDFLKYGYSSLKGEFKPYEPPAPDKLKDYQSLIDKLDFRENETTEEVDGKKLTVQELALKNLLEDYKKKVDDGEIKEGSEQYKFYFAMRALSDVSSGRSLETHFEQQWAGSSGTTRDLGENKADASGADMAAIIDPAKAKEIINKALSDPKVAEDFNKAMITAAGKVPGLSLERRQEELRELLSSDGFQNYFRELNKTDSKKASTQFQQLFSSYAALAGEKASNALGAELTRSGLTAELNDTLKNLDDIPDELWESATKDFISLALSYTTTSTFFAQEVANLARDPAFVNLLKNKEFVKGFAEIQKRWAGILSKGPVNAVDMQIFNQQLKSLSDKTFVNLADRNKVTKFFDALNKNGFLSTGTGYIALASSINKLTDGKGLSGDPQENLSIANGFMFWLANGNAQLQLGGEIGKFLKAGATKALMGITGGNLSPQDIELRNFTQNLIKDKLPKLPNIPGISTYVDKIKNQMIGSGSDKVKLASATGVVRILSSLGYTAFGALAMAQAGIGLAKADNPGDRAVSALNFAAGTFFTGAGAAQLASTFGLQAAAPWISRLGFAGIFLSVVALVAAEILGEKKENKVQVDYFDDLKDLGVLKEDWGDKLEFLTLYGYSRALPETGEGKSVFDTYDWKKWLDDYREENKGNNSTNPRVPDLHFVQSAENTLNAVVSIYGERINIDERTVPSMKGELRDQVGNLIKFYLQNIDSNDTAAEAADWAIEQIKARLGGAYEDGGEARDAADVLNGWLVRHDGKETLESIADDLIKELKLKPDPDENETEKEREPNGFDWSKVK